MVWCRPPGLRPCPPALPELSHAINHPTEPLAVQFEQILNLSEIFAPLLPLDPSITFYAPLISTLTDVRGAPHTFTRASPALYRASDGSWRIAAENVPRFENGRLLMEPGATNEFLNSAAPVTQTISLPTGTFTFSVQGSGSVTSSDNGGTATGHFTAVEGFPVTINVTGAGGILFAVDGSLDYVQVEAGEFPTSPIITGASRTAREPDSVEWAENGWFNQAENTMLVTIQPDIGSTDFAASGFQSVLTLSEQATRFHYLQQPSTQLQQRANDGTNVAVNNIVFPRRSVIKLAIKASTAEDRIELGHTVDGGLWDWGANAGYAGSFPNTGQLSVFYAIANAPWRASNIQAYNRYLSREEVEENY